MIRTVVRLATSIVLNSAILLLVARLLPGIVLQAGQNAARLGLFLLTAGVVATTLAWLAGRVRGTDGAGGPRRAQLAGIAFAGELGLLVALMAIGPAMGVRFGIGDLPAAVTAGSLVRLVLGAALLAAGVVAADGAGRWLATALDRAVAAANPTRTAVLAIFLLSGAAGLIYEVVWSRQLVLVFGNTTQAVSAILTGFFGGMAIGSVIGGRVADRVRRPLRLYGVIEIVLVAVVLITPLLFRGLHEVYRAGYASLENQPTALALLRYALALLALAPATVLMGATLPTLSRHLARRREELGGAFGRLYAINTVGAIVGTVAAGLVLIEILGLTGTLIVGAAASGTAGLSAILLDRRDQTADRGSVAETSIAGAPANTTARIASHDPAPRDAWAGRRVPLIVAFVSGLTSLGYQLLWTRLLASGSGNTTYVFTAILSVFLVGIAIGAAIVARQVGRSSESSGRAVFGRLGAVQVLVAAIVLAGLLVLSGQLPSLPFPVRVIIVVLPATLAIGLTLPLASSLVASDDAGIGRDAGLLLGSNTLGAIGGTFIIPFFLIPAIGSPASLVVLALVNLALGLGLLTRGTDLARVPRRIAASAGGALVALAIIALAVPNRLVMDPGATGLARSSVLLATAEDEIASVQAGGRQPLLRLLVGGTGMTRLTVDAKLMAYVPIITRPDAQRMLVICFGMGSSYRSGLIAGLDVDGVELVPSVPNMFGFFYPDAAQVLASPRGHLIITDGRNYVELSDRTYDLIVVDPPPPIESSGTSVLYSREFYRASKGRLTPGGVMMEWMPYSQTVDEFRAHVATFHDVFPNVLIAFGPTGKGVYMLGSDQPIAIDAANVRSVLARAGVVDDLVGTPDSPVTTADAWAQTISRLGWIEGDQVARFAAGATLILDDRPVTEYFLLRRLFGPRSPTMSEAHLLAATPPR